MEASGYQLHCSAQHCSALRKLSFFAPSCLQTVNLMSETFGLALYCHPAAADDDDVAAAEGEAMAVTKSSQKK
jgi:hypothetical protein